MIGKLDIEKFGKEELLDFKGIHDKTFVDVSVQIPRPPIALSMGHHTKGTSAYPTPFGTYGNFSCLVGASKSMKTFLKSALVAGYIGGRAQNYFPNLAGHDTEGKFVLDIDTEQSLWHTQNVARRVCDMVGTNPGFYRPFALREEEPKIRFQFIEWLIMESEYRKNIGMVAIDGAADVLESVNDLDLSNKIVQGMMTWSSSANCHIATVLHRNHGSEKPTGHLGSAIMKKAETVAFVTRDDDVTRVTPEYCRNVPFDEFCFELDENWIPRESEKEIMI
ncbi:MAG: AAA family ATPase [Bacteroidota bacterium]